MDGIFIENGLVKRKKDYEDGSSILEVIGGVTKTETIRIGVETVADVTYQFVFDAGQYIEQSRVERLEPFVPSEPSHEDRIVQLEAENLELKLAIAELAEVQQTDKPTLSSHLRSWLKS